MTEERAGKFVVQGRTFYPSEHTTFAQDMWVLDLADSIEVEKLNKASKKDLEATAQRILMKAYKSRKLFLLVAGLCIEEGKKWSEENAREWAQVFESAEMPEDKEALQGAMVAVLLSFFATGEGFSSLSPMSSPKNRKAAESLREHKDSHHDEPSGELSVSATGTP